MPSSLRRYVTLETLILFQLAPIVAVGQIDDNAARQETLSEQALIGKIGQLSEPIQTNLSLAIQLQVLAPRSQKTLALIDELLTRFPETAFKNEALIIKLRTLAELARTDPGYLRELLALTDKIGADNPTGELAAENAFHAIQGFVLGARLEKMPEEHRLLGTLERYEAFVEDYADSPLRPVIWASMIRNLIALERIERAEKESVSLHLAYPDHRATKRAVGEVYRATAVGKPYRLEYTSSDGKVVRTADYLGKVLVVHFWATWSRASMDGLPELITLHKEFADRGLQLIGVNVDKSRRRIDSALRDHDLSWPQYFDQKGLENDILVGSGVVKIPTYFVVDRRGVLRSIDPSEKLRDLVGTLLAESRDQTQPTGSSTDGRGG